MIHLDTNFLVDLVTVGSAGGAKISAWLKAGKSVAASSVAWSEFCNGPLSKAQKDAAFAVLDRKVLDFTRVEAEEAARLFNLSGRRRGSHADCMIAAAAIVSGMPLATFNAGDFERLVPFGLVLEG
ncbi:MAG: type II toxin-antitoxin system VapC family toxin [Luteolibacter sp.]|uniref:type II toxin-antitoxin system VapC family toxin n=1 Tax=Luteolibacter sp. TaxID=1962973 RepID=UPI0032663570